MHTLGNSEDPDEMPHNDYEAFHQVLVAQLVTCLATDPSLAADPGVARFDARSHTFVEIDHEIISMVILLPTAESFKNGCCRYK